MPGRQRLAILAPISEAVLQCRSEGGCGVATRNAPSFGGEVGVERPVHALMWGRNPKSFRCLDRVPHTEAVEVPQPPHR